MKFNWSDGHTSLFNFDWLKERNFTKENGQKYLQTEYRLSPKLWPKNQFKYNYKSFKYQDVIENDKTLQEWLEALTINGIALLTGAPPNEEETRKLIERVGFVRRTHYGEEFIVKAKEKMNNTAYLSAPLQMHTDLPYYEYVPGVTVLHCIIQTQSPGAFNLIADGFYAAIRLKNDNPKFTKV